MGHVRYAAYLDLENALIGAMQGYWRAYWAPIAKGIVAAAKAGDWDSAHALVDAIDLGLVAGKARRKAETLGAAALVLGAKNAGSGPVPDSGDAVESAVSQMYQMVDRNATLYLRKLGHALVQKLHRDSLEAVRKAYNPSPTPYVLPDGREFSVDLAVDGVRARLESGGNSFLGMASSLTMNRLRSYGFLQRAMESGVTTYRIQATLDERTSDFCRTIHGRTFTVQQGWEQITQELGTDDADVLRQISPWPDQHEMALLAYDRMTAEELASEGLCLPPYHPYCRTIIVLESQAEDSEAIGDLPGGAVAGGLTELLGGGTVETGAGRAGITLGSQSKDKPTGQSTGKPGAAGIGGGAPSDTESDGDDESDSVPTGSVSRWGFTAGLASGLALSSVLFGQYSPEELDEIIDVEDLPEYDAFDTDDDDSVYRILKAEWNEADHPRDERGRFTEKGNVTVADLDDDIAKSKIRVGYSDSGKLKGEVQNAFVSITEGHYTVSSLMENMGARHLKALEGRDVTLRFGSAGLGVGFRAQMSVPKKDGGMSVYIDRSFIREETGDIVAHHEMFTISHEDTGSGLAKKILADQMGVYKGIGVSRVDMYANVDIGGYAWAKYGFLPKDYAQLFGVQAYIRNEVLPNLPKLSPKVRDKINTLLESKDPKSIWALADMKAPVTYKPGHTEMIVPLGKALLMGSGWSASLNLNDKDQMDRFTAYVGLTKPTK